jgi:hypothetical protein
METLGFTPPRALMNSGESTAEAIFDGASNLSNSAGLYQERLNTLPRSVCEKLICRWTHLLQPTMRYLNQQKPDWWPHGVRFQKARDLGKNGNP